MIVIPRAGVMDFSIHAIFKYGVSILVQTCFTYPTALCVQGVVLVSYGVRLGLFQSFDSFIEGLFRQLFKTLYCQPWCAEF